MRERRQGFIAAAFALGLWLALFGPLVIGTRTLFFGDIALYFVPLLTVQKAALLQGRIPLWNPAVLCGTPFVGNPQAWPLYPSSWLLAVVSPAHATGLIGALHIGFALVGTGLFLRARGLRVEAALLGAIAWGLGGALVSKLQFPNMVQGAAYLPWVLLAIARLTERPTPTRTTYLALALGLALLAAHAQIFLMVFYVGAVWAGWLVGQAAKGERRRILCLLALAVVLGAGLAAGQLVPVVEMVRVSVRPALPLVKANRFILPPYAALYNFVLPDFFGNPATDTEYVARGNFWEPCAYLGLLPLALAVGAIRKGRGDGRIWAIVAFACLWLSLGRDAGLYTVAFYALPGLSRFHDPARWLLPGTFALACLAAQGADALVAGLTPRGRGAGCGLVALTALDVCRFSATLNPTTDAATWQAAVGPGGGQTVRAYQKDEGRIWGRFVSYRTYKTVAGGQAGAFLASGGANLPSLGGMTLTNGYEPVRRADSAAINDALAAAPQPSRLLRATGATVLLGFDRKRDRQTRQAVKGGGQAWLWTTWRVAPTPQDALAAVTRPGWDGVPVAATGEAAPRVGVPPAALVVAGGGFADPNRATIILPPAHPAGLVVWANTRHPGGEARVDGRPGRLLSVNGAFCGVGVGAGAKRIQWVYNPVSWRAGVFIMAVVAGILSAILAADFCRLRRLRSSFCSRW